MRVYQKLDEETIMIDGVKYQKVEEPKPPTLLDIVREWWDDDETFLTCDGLLDKIAGWLPDELEYEEDEVGYNQGWNACLNEIKENLR